MAPNNDLASAAEDSVSSTAGGASSGGAINLSSRPSSHTPENTSGNSAIVEPDSQEDQVINYIIKIIIIIFNKFHRENVKIFSTKLHVSRIVT